MSEKYFTEEGFEALCFEIEEMNRRAKEEAIRMAQSAKEERGEASNNSPFMQARGMHTTWAIKAKELAILKNSATVIVPEPFDGTIQIGRLVAVRDLSSRKGKAFWIGSCEIFEQPKRGRLPIISYKTGLASNLLGKEVGDEIEFTHAGKKFHYQVLRVE